jgi:hypothetical protein
MTLGILIAVHCPFKIMKNPSGALIFPVIFIIVFCYAAAGAAAVFKIDL